MDQVVQNRLAKRLIDYSQHKTTALAPHLLEVSPESYLDDDVWHAEVDTLFKRLPLGVCLSKELPVPGSYLAQSIVGVPILVTRDADGKVHAFLNMCTHRGANIAPETECAGTAGRFVCPYHAWTFDNQGRLIAVQDSALFGEVDRVSHGLTRLHADERLAMVFAILTPGVTIDIGEYLADVGDYFGEPSAAMTLVGTRTVKGGHWKFVVEGHLESYHFSTLHRNSIAAFMMNNGSTSDQFGIHHSITFCAKSRASLAMRPEEEWRPIDEDHIQPQFHFFPGKLVTRFRDAMLVQMVRPGADPRGSTNRIAVVAGPASHINAAKLDQTAALVENEDYGVSHDILQGMASGARRSVLFGRNEQSVHHFHESLDHFMGRA